MMSIQAMLEEMAAIYAKNLTEKIDLTVKFKLLPDNEVWFLKSKPGQRLKITSTC